MNKIGLSEAGLSMATVIESLLGLSNKNHVNQKKLVNHHSLTSLIF